MVPAAQNGAREPQKPRVIPPNPLRAALVVVAFVACLYLVEFVDQILTMVTLQSNGIDPRDLDGLDGIIWAPVLHAGWTHLISNTLPLLILGWLVMSGGIRQFLGVTAFVWILGGLGTWLVGGLGTSLAHANHIGASGLAFGWLLFLLVRGFFARSLGQIVVAVVLFVFLGSMLWGVLPGQHGVSWEAHLFGALSGLIAGWFVGRRNRLRSQPRGSSAPGTLAT